MIADKDTASEKPQKLGIALQGAFGHETYALGIMSAFQQHHIAFHAASGCVATLLPLWLYCNKHYIDINTYFAQSGAPVHPILSPALLDLPTWSHYAGGLQQDIAASVSDPGNYDKQRRLLANLLGYAGGVVFNRTYFEGRRREFETLMDEVSIPVFTNALNAQNFSEVYLYSGPLSAADLQNVRGKKWHRGKREVAKMNLDRFIASGARAPLLAPVRVHLDQDETHDKQEHDEYWMEGAMRCNPPLNPLFDVGSTTILLVRLFAKNKPTGKTDNEAELLDRYLETIFTAPLEKEIEMIEVLARSPQKKQAVTILDPASDVTSFAELVQVELDYLSHYDTFNLFRPDQPIRMFERGKAVGEAIVARYRHHLHPYMHMPTSA